MCCTLTARDWCLHNTELSTLTRLKLLFQGEAPSWLMCLPSRPHRAASQASNRGSEKRAVLSPKDIWVILSCHNQLLEQKCNWHLSRWCPEILLAKHPTADQTVRNYEQLLDPKCQSVSELRNYALEQGCPTFQTVVEWCHLQRCWVEFTAILRCTWPVMQPVGHRLDMPAPTGVIPEKKQDWRLPYQ